MNGNPDFTTVEQLRQISHNNLVCFTLNLADENSTADLFYCTKILRCLPGKRLACVGEWRGKAIFAKLFIDSKRAKVHWQREEQGIRALIKNKIPTPALTNSGVLPQPGGFYSFFDYYPEGKNTKDVWDASNSADRRHLFRRLVGLLARHHAAGIMQNDLHLNNFLLAEDELYTLDGADITVFEQALNIKQSLGNLAACFAQFYPENDKDIDDILLYYSYDRGWKIRPEHIQMAKRNTVIQRKKRKFEFLKKINRECTAFVSRRRWTRLTICDRQYDTDEIKGIITNIDRVMAQGNTIKKGNTSTVVSVSIKQGNLMIKRYNIKNWQHAVSRAFRPSRADRSWENAHRLCFYGIDTPKPIAFVENRWGPVRRKAYYISEFSPGCSSSEFFLNPNIEEEQKVEMAEKVVQLLEKLRELKISHGDLKSSNLLINGRQVSLIDLDAMKEYSFDFAFKRAWEKDIKRFFKNWAGSNSLTKLFKLQFEKI